jgi:phage portal protein BeeE
MGFLSDLAGSSKPPAGQGQDLWREVFGSVTNKEEGLGARPRPSDDGGSYGRGVHSADAAVTRLLRAMRSKAPGGWSDDRYEAARHFVGIVYVAIHRQNELLSQAEFEVSVLDDTQKDGVRPVSKRLDPEAYKLHELLARPNPQDTFGDLMANWNLHMDLYGSSLTWMAPNKLGRPMELYPVPVPLAVPQPAVNPEYPHGYYRIQPVYPYGPFSSHPTPNSAVGAPIPAEWMIRIKYPHPLLRYDGYSPLTGMRHHIDESEMMDRARTASMKKVFRPNAVLNMSEMEGGPGGGLPEAEVERIRAQISAFFEGPENVGNLFIPPPGASMEEFGSRPVDMDYPAGWDQVTGFVLGGGFGVTKPAAGMIEDSSYSTLFATLKQLYWLTLDPKCTRIAAQLTRQLAPHFGPDVVIKIRCKRIDDHEITFSKVDKISGMKGLPESVIRYQFRLMDLPEDAEAIKDLAEAGQEAMMGMPGMPGQGPQAAPDGEPGPPAEDGTTTQPADQLSVPANDAMQAADGSQMIEQSRPNPGSLNRGSLGPRMKSLHDLRRTYGAKALRPSSNGTHKLNGKH